MADLPLLAWTAWWKSNLLEKRLSVTVAEMRLKNGVSLQGEKDWGNSVLTSIEQLNILSLSGMCKQPYEVVCQGRI